MTFVAALAGRTRRADGALAAAYILTYCQDFDQRPAPGTSRQTGSNHSFNAFVSHVYAPQGPRYR
jgi:hypothetical protein